MMAAVSLCFDRWRDLQRTSHGHDYNLVLRPPMQIVPTVVTNHARKQAQPRRHSLESM
jgi:hypothetical protein